MHNYWCSVFVYLSACESGFVTVWEVPNDGLTETINNPFVVLKGYFAKIFLDMFEPVYF